jgi:hypothetical protein
MRLLMVSPDIVMVNITPKMLNQIREILKINYDTARQKQVIGYDTQFNLGDFYTYTKSGKCPVLPAVQVIHERKLQLHHEVAWEVITNIIPEIKTRKLVAVSDDEFTPLLEKYVRKGLVAKCEVHGAKKVERWVSTHGGNKDEGRVLKSDFRCIFLLSHNWEGFKTKWYFPWGTGVVVQNGLIHPENELFSLQKFDFLNNFHFAFSWQKNMIFV